LLVFLGVFGRKKIKARHSPFVPDAKSFVHQADSL